MLIYFLGDSRAILCTEDKDNKISICQLSSDHTFSNDDELLRLSHLGLDVQKLQHQPKSGLQNCTRCIGNYTVKGGYREFDNLRYYSIAYFLYIFVLVNMYSVVPINLFKYILPVIQYSMGRNISIYANN